MSNQINVVNYALPVPRCVAIVIRCLEYRGEVFEKLFGKSGTCWLNWKPGRSTVRQSTWHPDGRRLSSTRSVDDKKSDHMTSGLAPTAVDQFVDDKKLARMASRRASTKFVDDKKSVHRCDAQIEPTR